MNDKSSIVLVDNDNRILASLTMALQADRFRARPYAVQRQSSTHFAHIQWTSALLASVAVDELGVRSWLGLSPV